MKILIAEDGANILNGLCEIFEGEGYACLRARDGRRALELFDETRPDFVCLDVMMPGLSGYDVCRAIRERDPRLPVIFITAKTEEADRVAGLELGGDDYICKPFGVREVVARVRAVTRRCLAQRAPGEEEQAFRMGPLEVLPAELRARRDGCAIELSLRDIAILRSLHRRSGQAVDRHTLFSEVWGLEHIPNSRTLDQHISQLRKRIGDDPRNPRIIRTVHGVGYRFED